MKDFLGTLQRMYGVKPEYKTHQIVEAYNAFCLSQVSNIKDIPKWREQGYWMIIEKGHKWEGLMVKVSPKPNKDGLVLCYYGTQTTYVHKSFLQ